MGPAQDAVQAAVLERDPVVADRVGQALAALGADGATQLEDIREVGVERDRHVRALGRRRVIRNQDPLAQAAGNYALAHDADRLSAQDDLRAVDYAGGIGEQVRVGELGRRLVARRRPGPQHDRVDAVELHVIRRQHARIGVVQAQAAAVGTDVSVGIGEHEQVLVLEDVDAGQVRGTDDGRVTGVVRAVPVRGGLARRPRLEHVRLGRVRFGFDPLRFVRAGHRPQLVLAVIAVAYSS